MKCGVGGVRWKFSELTKLEMKSYRHERKSIYRWQSGKREKMDRILNDKQWMDNGR